MSATVRETVIAAMVSALNAARAGQLPTCTRWSGQSEVAANLPSLHLLGGHQESRVPGPNATIAIHTMEVLAVIRVSVAGSSIEQTADPIYSHVVKTLCSSTLGGQVHWIREKSYEPDVEQEDRPYGEFTVTLDVEYHARQDNPELTN